MDRCVIGLDIGTTTICGVAVSHEGAILSSVERPNDSAIGGLPAGRAEQNPQRIRERAFEVLKTLRAEAGQASAIGLTGQMHGMLCVGVDNAPLSPLITWQDGRCLERDLHGHSALEEMRLLVPDAAWAVCGCRPASGFLGSTLFWLCRHGALPAGTRRASFVHDWLGGVLTGQLPVTDPSDAGSAGIFDLARLAWHDSLIGALELPVNLLPEVRESGEAIGTLCPAAAAATGFAAGTPVCNALGDNQASVMGSLADPAGSVLINLGTGGQISWAVDEFRRAEGMETRYLPGRRYMLVGASLCGGRAYAWLNEVVQNWAEALGSRPSREQVYEKLTALASAAPADAGGLRAETTLAGTRDDPALRGRFDGIGLDNFTLGHVARAVLAGMVAELADHYTRCAGPQAQRHTGVGASGNAVRKNPLLRTIIAERLGKTVRIPRHREEAAFGAALIAGVGAKIWPNAETAGQCVQYE